MQQIIDKCLQTLHIANVEQLVIINQHNSIGSNCLFESRKFVLPESLGYKSINNTR